MTEYHKIQGLFKRDEKTHKFIEGDYSLPELEYLAENLWVFTEKVDGTNIRVEWLRKPEPDSSSCQLCDSVQIPMDDGWPFFLAIKGKTDRAQIPSYLMEVLLEMFPEDLFKTVFPESPVILYGEGYGRKIQKKGSDYNPEGNSFVLFDVKIGRWWLKREDVEKVAAELGISVVPVIGEGTLAQGIQMVKTGIKSAWGDFEAEGIVARPKVELVSRNGGRVITKIKGVDFNEKCNG